MSEQAEHAEAAEETGTRRPLVSDLVERMGELSSKAMARASEDWEDDAVSEQRRERERLWVGLIPFRFRDANVGDFDEGSEERRTICEWNDGPRERNLVLLGPVGVGKTHAAIAAARTRFDEGERCLFYPVVELLDLLRPGGERSELQRATFTRVLILDDLGAENPTDWTAERLYSLVNRRWLEKLPTIITSNLEVDALKDKLDPRLFSRIADGALAFRLTGDDRRRA